MTENTPAVTTTDPENEVLITGEATKLPAPYADYIDPQKPLAADVVFFEKKVTFEEMTKTIALSGGIGCLGVPSVIIGIAILFDHSNAGPQQTANFTPLFFGITCLFAAWMLAQGLKVSRAVMQKQQRGEPTRVGIFLTPGTLFVATESDYTIIPRSQFRGLGGSGRKTVQYLFKGQEKQFSLPGSLVRDAPAALLSAIEQWSKTA
ncbi:MAG: hypothetical protein QM758_09035 [Armatimonas sp.]